MYRVAKRCVAGAINNYTTQLLDYGKQASQYNLTEALLFLSHFMGDIHQFLTDHTIFILIVVAFKSMEDHKKQMELEEARKVGRAPAKVDEDGKDINPYIPQYMPSAPWKWKSDPNYTKSWYDRGAKIYQADKYRKGACKNCGAMTHTTKTHMERPRKLGAKWTSKNIAPDEKIETFELDYDGKRDMWNGYDATSYAHVIERYEACDEARKKFLKDQQLKKLEEKGNSQNVEEAVSDDEDNVGLTSKSITIIGKT
ncbi:unnamed protein product [Lactuca saligna]|uniref:Pre-mRNA-splicing factor SLU7 n=1 Tax=Lactuca saligna TaxID=75948 RepID=A0AA36EL14_LACSI|nr:unnamed protein product [Lactuca saligna]